MRWLSTLNFNFDSEAELVKKLIIASVIGHSIVILGSLPRWFSSPIDLSQSIEAELVLEPLDKGISKAPEIKQPEPEPELLPQLPKKFNLPDTPPPDEVADIKAEKEKEIQKKREADLIELTKNEALARLLKEKKRREQLEVRKNDQEIAQIKDKLTEKKQLISENIGSPTENLDPYILELKIWVQKFYVLPEVYRSGASNFIAIVEIVLDVSGKIETITLHESSKNSGFDTIAVQTLEKASPLPRPPKNLVGKPIHYRFNSGEKL